MCLDNQQCNILHFTTSHSRKMFYTKDLIYFCIQDSDCAQTCQALKFNRKSVHSHQKILLSCKTCIYRYTSKSGQGYWDACCASWKSLNFQSFTAGRWRLGRRQVLWGAYWDVWVAPGAPRELLTGAIITANTTDHHYSTLSSFLSTFIILYKTSVICILYSWWDQQQHWC